jgi:hypothetical protein
VIGNVEGFETECQAVTFPDPESLMGGEVPGLLARSDDVRLRPMLPMTPAAGITTAAVLNQRSRLRSLSGRLSDSPLALGR